MGKKQIKNLFILLSAICLLPVSNAMAACVNFETLTLGANYNVGDSFTDAGTTVHFNPFTWSNGNSTSKGFGSVGNRALAGGAGLEMAVNNINMDFIFPTGLTGLSFLFGEYGGNLNIDINGDFRNFSKFADIHGTIIGGVKVAVTNGLGNDKGTATLSGTIVSFSIGGQELWIDNVCPTSDCDTVYPDPQVSLTGTENVSVSGNNFVRYFLSVDNRDQYPDAMFAANSTLPACGLNTSSSRTWVGIFDQDDKYIYAFCALGSAEDLDGLWFSVAEGNTPPAGVYVILWDRLCDGDWVNGYKSPLVTIDPTQFGEPPTDDLEIQSTWAGIAAPVIDGTVSPGEWDGAGSLPLYENNGMFVAEKTDRTDLQRGTMYVKNSDVALFILFDMTSDTTSGGNAADDYSGIGFDIDIDHYKSPYVDLKYGTGAGTENLGIQYAVSEVGWTGVNSTALSSYKEGFGPSAASATNHMIYEYKLDYSEIDIDFEDVLANPEQLFHARVNVKVVSKSPAFSMFYPSSQYGPWSNPMILISLDKGTMVVDQKAPIFAGIGLVPITFIDQTTGLATTGPSDMVKNLQDAPFGSHLRVIGNVDKVRGMGITYYAIGYCNMGLNGCGDISSGSFDLNEWKFVTDAKSNYYWSGTQGKYVLDNVAPEEIFNNGTLIINAYPMPSAALSWYLPNLLFDWRTTGTVKIGSGLYKLHFFGFSAKSISSYVSTPINESTMVVKIDNTTPVMAVNSISYKGNDIDGCGMVQLDDAKDVLLVNVSAYDPDSHLYNYSLQALYGNNQSFICHSTNYASWLLGGGTGPLWQGAFSSADYQCMGDAGSHWETSCAYTFRVSGWDRAINGYGRIHYNSAWKSITVLMPGFSMP